MLHEKREIKEELHTSLPYAKPVNTGSHNIKSDII
jgi:hypothetical protein